MICGLLCLFCLSLFQATELRAAEVREADVIVVGATPGGVAAAVAASRGGASVIVIEESNHVGGVVSGGLTNTDIRKQGAIDGLFDEFQERIVEYYSKTYGPESEQLKICRHGNIFEPKVAEQIFREMLSENDELQLQFQQRVIAAQVMDASGQIQAAKPGIRIDGPQPKAFGPVSRLVSIKTQDITHPEVTTEYRAKVFIDATYEGDLAAIAGVPYRVGRESKKTFNEAHAGKIYVRFHDENPLPGSTGEADAGIQAFCFRFHVTKDSSNRVPVEKPHSYQRSDYSHLLEDIKTERITKVRGVIQLYPMPNNKFEVNSDHPDPIRGAPSESLDLAEENWAWPEAGPETRAKIFQRYWDHNEGLLWFLQHDEEVPVALREEALQYGFPKDEFTDHNHRPHQIYVRQGRRIWGEYNFTENDVSSNTPNGLPKRQPDGIAIVEYALDCHGVTKYDPAHPGVREGYFYINFDPTQLPYRIMVPQCVDGLLVPVACSASHVGYQPIRMEPVFMALGEACGIAATEAIRVNAQVRHVNVSKVQREILNRGGVIMYEPQSFVPAELN
jgi:flavin-dependent dehydrogenase